MTNSEQQQRNTTKGTRAQLGRHGAQVVRTHGHRWSDEAETVFLDHLAATANVMASAAACGFTSQALYARRRRDPGFQKRWEAALAQGYAHIEALLVQRAIEALEGFAPDPKAAVLIRDMTVKDALILLGHHRRTVEGGPKSRRQWARPRSLEEMRDSILGKLAVVAPRALLAPGGSPSRLREGSGVDAPAGGLSDTGPPPAPPASGRGDFGCPTGGRGDSGCPACGRGDFGCPPGGSGDANGG